MKRIVLCAMGLVLTTTGFVQAATAKTVKITNTRLIQAVKNTTITYGGVRIFVPAGQAIILGQYSDGAIVVRGKNLNGIKLDNSTISSRGDCVLNYEPQTHRLEVARAESVTVQDANGKTAVLSQGAAVTASDILVPVGTKPSVETVKTASVAQVQQQDTSTVDVPDFVAESETSSAASEQASQDVEETEKVLSQSAL